MNRRRWLGIGYAGTAGRCIVLAVSKYFSDRPMSVITSNTSEEFQRLPDGSQITLNRFSALHYRLDSQRIVSPWRCLLRTWPQPDPPLHHPDPECRD
ncbi:MAG: hypothetical protein R2824_17655 [Saprospiraceae bacterium]